MMPDDVIPVPTVSAEGQIWRRHPDNLISDEEREKVMNLRFKTFKKEFKKAMREIGLPHFTFKYFMDISSDPKHTPLQDLENLLQRQTVEYIEPPENLNTQFITPKVS